MSLADLEAQLDAVTTPAERLAVLNALAWELHRTNSERSGSYAQMALELALQLNDERGWAEALRTQARLHYYASRIFEGLETSLQALEIAIRAGAADLEPAILNSIAASYRQLGDTSNSLKYYLQQIERCRTLGDRMEAARATIGIGVLHYDAGEFTSFVRCAQEALGVFEQGGDTYWQGIALNNICYGLFKLKRYTEALQAGQRCLDLYERTPNQRGRVRVLGSMAEICLEMGDPEQCLEYLEDSRGRLPLGEAPDLDGDMMQLTGRALAAQGDYDGAIQFLKQALEIAESHRLNTQIFRFNLHLSDVYRRRKEFERALEHYERFHNTKEQVNSEESAQKLRNLEVLQRTQAAQQEAEYYARLYEQTRQFNTQLEEEVHKRTEDLRLAYDQLERLDRTKTDFITVTAHELRTPLTVLAGYIQLLVTDSSVQEDAQKKTLLDGMRSGANRLSEIIETMLLMLKIDSRALQILSEPIDLNAMIRDLAGSVQKAVADRSQKLRLGEELEALPPVEGDESVIKIVLRNILQNAVKYTPDGGTISVHGCAWEQPPSPDLPAPAVEIIIADTGIGIDPAVQELIFTKFYRTQSANYHSSGKTKFKGGGPGLGLAIARGIIEAHQGRLWVESEGYDEQSLPGSSFHIVIPLKQ